MDLTVLLFLDLCNVYLPICAKKIAIIELIDTTHTNKNKKENTTKKNIFKKWLPGKHE